MDEPSFSIRAGLDRFGVLLSGACAVHCVAWVVFASVLGIGGDAIGAPVIHHVGLALAVLVGVLNLGVGALRHRRAGALAMGACGLGLMTLALFVAHGPREAALTVAGVVLLGFAHRRNLHAHDMRAQNLHGAR